ncbi:MAG: flagellar biosynthetic protein FliR [Chloroflexota bacterium]|nr:MAG: flagellar biosynthetic protein FliR [Chloroflexota bacterium]
MDIPVTSFQAFFLVFTRVGGVVVTLPILSSRNIPAPAKIGLAALLAFTMMPGAIDAQPVVPNAFLPFLLVVAQELLVGLAFGFAAQVVFSGLQTAGQLIGTQMGLTIASAFDPVSQSQQVNYIDQLYTLLAGLVFLTINGHHWTILALQQSFEIVPLGRLALGEAVANDFVRLTAEALVMSVRIGLPVAATLIVTDVAFLLIGRSAPQMNVFFVGQPLKIGIGLVAFFVALPVMVGLMGTVFKTLSDDLMRLLQLIGA